MKTYTFELVIEEGNDEFWETITANGDSGCDAVRNEILDTLSWKGFGCSVRLLGYSDN